ncbi:MAG TPA: protein kinase [Gemmataceae bacterium]|nr:protein kinase [Gemmataceae bacterium]
MITQSSCPDRRWWQDFLDGTLSAPEQDGLAKHLDSCPRCLQTLERLTAASRSWPAAVLLQAENEVAAAPALSRVMQELKAEGSQTGACTDPYAASHDTLPFLQPAEDAAHMGRLGGYEVIEVIGRGGMGVVLKAFDPALHRLVAIKVLAPQWVPSSAARHRFAREARAMAAVRHDHVVAVYDVDEVNGQPYLVMEYVPGGSLQQRLDETGPLEVKEAVRIGMQTAMGLAAAHAQDLIHRDVKPANILLEHGEERVKLSDFGLARAMDDASLTQSGMISGTPQYMAPEQARGAALDHRADLFSLGGVLYAACTGRPPFRAPSTLAVLHRVCEDTPRDVQELNPEIPDWLVKIIDTLHAKDPEERFQSAAEVAELLEQHLAHLENPELVRPPRLILPRRPGRRGSRRRWRLVAWAAVLLVLVTGAACWWFLTGREPAGGNGEALQPGAVQPRVLLSGGFVSQKFPGKRLSFQVHYRFTQGNSAGAMRWRWVVQRNGQNIFEKILPPGELAAQGTLQGTTFTPVLLLKGPMAPPMTTFLLIEGIPPGQNGWQQEAVSNVLILP